MNAVVSMSAILYPMITFPYVSRVLGASGNGKIAFANAAAAYFVMFAQMGIPTYGIRACAFQRKDVKELKKTADELLIISLLSALVVYVVFAVSVLLVPRFREACPELIVVSSLILFQAVGMEWFFKGLEEYGYIAVRDLAFKALAILLMLLMVRRPEHYIRYAAVGVVAAGGPLFTNFVLAQKRLRPVGRSGRLDLRRHIKPILVFFSMSVAVSVYTNMDVIMLGFLAGDAEVGFYTASTRMKTLSVSLVTALGGVLLPRLSSYFADGNTGAFREMVAKSMKFSLIAGSPIALYLGLMADQVLRFLAGTGYAGAVIPMRLISVTILLIAVSNVTGLQILVPTGREKDTAASTVLGAVVNVVLNYLLIPVYGATGAVLGTIAAETAVLLFQGFALRKEMPEFLKGVELYKIIAADFGAGALLLGMRSGLAMDYQADWGRAAGNLVMTGLIFCAFYTAVLVLLKESMVREYMERGKLLIKRKHQ